MGCPVITGQAPHNADGTQRTEMTKGTDPPQFPNEAWKGKCIKLKVKVNSRRQPGEITGRSQIQPWSK